MASVSSIRLDAAAGELDYVETLLERNGLPAEDVGDSPANFYVATVGGERIGVGGIEPYGRVGLLRSVVVDARKRGVGYGSAICDALETRARKGGVKELYLLTTTASGFFSERGYAAIERTDAPEAIRNTTEFADLCPASAVCMRKTLN
ncbi:amino-acid N-acetyltransferase [Halorubrum xinjiangense]|uniref:Amino-acid N-acetyltransferase n=1 Tax=Halorubrum xinjiangense TaxID=261291 RepID=A0A1G7LZJ5_9EURY|nr:arsenic resistance N-acetyltransferase ArsN2 [Halorubrum xinjiangense]SDF54935.1 amino-acid N-acetyltransferase [Halorubrum xinjiangense]